MLLLPCISKLQLLRPSTRLFSVSSMQSASSSKYRDEGICVNTTGDIICAWHPQPKFPYEFSQPIQRSEITDTNSKLKVQHVEGMKDLYHYKHERFQRRELMRLTWTTKHRWFPNFGRRERLKIAARNLPREKEYL